MKKIIAVICSVLILSVVLCSCGVKLPEEPATTKVENYSVQKEFDNSETEDAKKIQTIDDIDFVIADYYLYGKSYAVIENIEMEDYGIGKIIGFANVNLKGISGSDKDFKIGYKTYDAKGNQISESYILAAIKNGDYKQGDTVQCRFDIPRNAGVAKIEFFDFVNK